MTDAPDATMTAAVEIDVAPQPCNPSLQLDVAMVLVQCHRDRLGNGVFRPDVSTRRLEEFAAVMACSLAHRIGGRYIPKRNERTEHDRIAQRDAAVVAALARGTTKQHVMREFKISRRLLYAILARTRRAPGVR